MLARATLDEVMELPGEERGDPVTGRPTAAMSRSSFRRSTGGASSARCCTALDDQQEAPPFEIVVVDDGSTDGTFEWLEERATARPVRRLRQQNRGPAAARNRGVAAAAGAIVAFLGDDTVPEPGWLAAHWAVHQREPGRGPAGGASVTPPGIRGCG